MSIDLNEKNVQGFRAVTAITDRGYGVKLEGSAQNAIELCDTAGEYCLGVALWAIDADAMGSIAQDGDVECVCSQAIAIGDLVTVDAAGKFAVANTAGQQVFGQAMSATAADGETFTCHVLRGYGVIPA